MQYFSHKNYIIYLYFYFQWVGSIDLQQNDNANANVIVKRDASLLEQVIKLYMY
jgi:hypothetical protein